MTRYFNIDRYERQKYGLISIYILLFDTNTSIHSAILFFFKVMTYEGVFYKVKCLSSAMSAFV